MLVDADRKKMKIRGESSKNLRHFFRRDFVPQIDELSMSIRRRRFDCPFLTSILC